MPPRLREFFIKKRAAQAEKASGPSLSLSMPMAFGLGLVLLSAIGWAFYLGFMVGRGDNPEKHIQSMAGILGKETSAQEPAAEADQADSSPEKIQAPAGEAAAAEGSPAPAQKQPYPFSRPKEHQLGAWGEDKPAQAQKSAPARKAAAAKTAPIKTPPAKKPAAPTAKGEIFDFTFQAAAYKNAKEAENLKKTLAKNGINARTSKNGKVWLVIATTRGNEGSANALRQKLQGLKLGKPLLLSKKAVAAKPKKGAR